MPYANIEDKKRSDRLYRQRRLEAGLCERCGKHKRGRKTAKCKACIQLDIQRHKALGPKFLAYRCELRLKHKQQIIDAYGGRCVCCGEKRHQFLTIDHEHGEGTRHRASMSSPEAFYRWLRVSNYPKGYRILCHSCHFSATRLGWCVHKPRVILHAKKLLMTKKAIRDRATSSSRRLQVIRHYGGECVCCWEDDEAFLQIDHENGGGKAHQRKVGKGTHFYAWLIRNNFKTKEKLVVLCASCNGAKHSGAVCPHDSAENRHKMAQRAAVMAVG